MLRHNAGLGVCVFLCVSQDGHALKNWVKTHTLTQKRSDVNLYLPELGIGEEATQSSASCLPWQQMFCLHAKATHSPSNNKQICQGEPLRVTASGVLNWPGQVF